MCWSLFIVKLQTSKIATLLERDSKTGIFFMNIAEFLGTRLEKHLQTAASETHLMNTKLFTKNLYSPE